MIPVLLQGILAIIGANVIKMHQTLQRAQQEPLTHLNVMLTSMNALMSPFEALHKAPTVIHANQSNDNEKVYSPLLQQLQYQ
jgi:hypothetical protein